MLKAYHLEMCTDKVLHKDVGMTGTSEQYSCKCGKWFWVVDSSGDRERSGVVIAAAEATCGVLCAHLITWAPQKGNSVWSTSQDYHRKGKSWSETDDICFNFSKIVREDVDCKFFFLCKYFEGRAIKH